MHISDMLLNTYLGSGFVIITIFFKIKEEDSATISKPVQNYTPSSQHTPPKKTPSRAHLECSAMDDNFLCEEMKNLLLHVLMIFFPLPLQDCHFAFELIQLMRSGSKKPFCCTMVCYSTFSPVLGIWLASCSVRMSYGGIPISPASSPKMQISSL